MTRPGLARSTPTPATGATPGETRALALVLQRVRLHGRMRTAWLRRLWAAELAVEPAGDGIGIGHAEIDAVLADSDPPDAERAWRETDPALAPLRQAIAAVDAALAADRESRIDRLCTVFGLGSWDRDALHATLALGADPSLGRLYGYLQDHAGRVHVTAELVGRLFGHERTLAPWRDSALLDWGLAGFHEYGAGEPPVLRLEPGTLAWLAGGAAFDTGALAGRCRAVAPLPPLENWPVAAATRLVARALQAGDGGRVRIAVAGPPGIGRRSFAAAVAAGAGLPLVAIDAAGLEGEAWTGFYRAVQRAAFLDGAAPAWAGAPPPPPTAEAPFPIQFDILDPGAEPTVDAALRYRFDLAPTTLGERERLWRRHVPTAASWSAEALAEIARRYRAMPGEIAAIGRLPDAGPAEAVALLRQETRARMGNGVKALDTPYGWDDLVLPARLGAALEDLIFEAEDRGSLWEQPAVARMYAQGRGLLALFNGPPGTGKTMAAQVIAARLGLELLRIDLAQVVSRYVGDATRTLDRILAQARHAHAVLFFDEADALFGKRTEVRDAHDRYANTDTDYLLQAVEDYPGIAILATNRRGNVDPAFLRRLRFVLEFPRPDAEQRETLWRRLVAEVAAPPEGECSRRLDAVIRSIATSVELTGAQIKGAVLTGLYAARRDGAPLGLPHLLRGIDRELMKDGQALSARDQKRWLDQVDAASPGGDRR